MSTPRRANHKARRVLMLVDAETVVSSDPQFRDTENPAAQSMEHHIAQGLRVIGHEVTVLACTRDCEALIGDLRRLRPEVVFNLVEHIRGDRRLSPRIPALLDLLQLPYTGCTETGIARSLDKAVSKYIVREAGIGVPRFSVLTSQGDRLGSELPFPAIVKPRFGGGSEGLTSSSVVQSENRMKEKALEVNRRFGQDAICEEFIRGREVSVGLVGLDGQITVFPTRETVFGRAAEGGPDFCTEIVKSSAAYRNRWGISYRRANLGKKMEARIAETCRLAFRALGLSGYSRIDLRMSEDGKLHFLEANPNPDLSPRVFGVMASWLSMDYGDLLNRILDLAFAASRQRA